MAEKFDTSVNESFSKPSKIRRMNKTQTEEFQRSILTFTPAAWAAGGNLGTARYHLSGAGTQTAGLAFAGATYPPTTNKNESEEYNGAAWAEGDNVNVARRYLGGTGTQTAGLAFAGIGDTDDTEEYNGTSWTENNNLNTGRYVVGSAGTQTAALCIAGG